MSAAASKIDSTSPEIELGIISSGSTITSDSSRQSSIEKIEEKKEELFQVGFFLDVASELGHQAYKRPFNYFVKGLTFTTATAALFPLSLGSYACFSAFRVAQISDLHSKELSVKSNAVQVFSNLGHGVGYLVEGAEMMHDSASWLLEHCIQIVQRRMEEKDEQGAKLNELIEAIEIKKEEAISLLNLQFSLDVGAEFAHQVYERPSFYLRKGIIFAGSLATAYPFALGSYACFDAFYIAKVSDIDSEDLAVASNAVQLYGNLGHAIGYFLEGTKIIRITSNWLFGKSFETVKKKEIEKIYEDAIEQESSEEVKEALRQRLEEELKS